MLEEQFLVDECVPSTRPEVVLIPVDEGLLVEGGRETEVLTGVHAISLLPTLIPLIDGRRTVREIISCLPITAAQQARNVLIQLLEWRVLIHASGVHERRTGRNASVAFAYKADPKYSALTTDSTLNRTVVTVCDDSSAVFGSSVGNLLRENGFDTVQTLQWHELGKTLIPDDAFLLSIVDSGTPPEAGSQHYAFLKRTELPFMRIAMHYGEVWCEVGPVFWPDTNLCRACLAERLPEHVPSSRIAVDEKQHWSWAGVVASVVTLDLIRQTPSTPRYSRYISSRMRERTLVWPFAAQCLHDPGASIPLRPLSVRYETTLFETQSSASSMDDPLSGVTIMPSPKLLLNSPWFPLPSVNVSLDQRVTDSLLFEGRPARAAVSLENLASLLALSVGCRNGPEGSTMRRWAPTGGNLGSPEAYVIAREAIGDIDPGVYLYSPEKHQLGRLTQPSQDDVEKSIATIRTNASVVVAIVGACQRLYRKYGSFAYKLAHLDAGVASSQLLMLAHALKVPIEPSAWWHTLALSRTLRLRAEHEIPVQVFELGSRRQNGSAAAEGYYSSVQALKEPMVHTSIQPGQVRASANELVSTLLQQASTLNRLPRITSRPSLSGIVRIFHDWNIDMTLGTALAARSSIRTFSSRSVDATILYRILYYALHPFSLHEAGLKLTVLIQNVTGLRAGRYVYDVGHKKLVYSGLPLARQRLGELFRDVTYEGCPLAFLFSVNQAILGDDHNPSYEALVVRAGVFGHRFWMASLAMGLGGVLVAGVYPSTTRRSSEVIEIGDLSMMAFLCGYSAAKQA